MSTEKDIKAVIIEDEPGLRETNKMLLSENFPFISVAGEAGNVLDAIETIKKVKPDIVFLDIELEDGSGFHVLQKCKPYKFKTIFVTAYNQYAIKAIKFSAIDYILKPVNEFEFCNAVQNALESIEEEGVHMQVQNFFDQYQNNTQSKKMVLRTSEALHLTDISDILYCKSDNSYTTFYLKDKKPVTVSKGIKEFATMLEEFGFLRPHQSFLVNLNCISKIDKTDGGFVIMSNNDEIPISTRRKQVIMDALEML